MFKKILILLLIFSSTIQAMLRNFNLKNKLANGNNQLSLYSKYCRPAAVNIKKLDQILQEQKRLLKEVEQNIGPNKLMAELKKLNDDAREMFIDNFDDINPAIPDNLNNQITKEIFIALIKYSLMYGYEIFNENVVKLSILENVLENALVKYKKMVGNSRSLDRIDFYMRIHKVNQAIDIEFEKFITQAKNKNIEQGNYENQIQAEWVFQKLITILNEFYFFINKIVNNYYYPNNTFKRLGSAIWDK